MNDWHDVEILRLRALWPDLQSDRDCLIPNCSVPAGWDRTESDIAVRIPPNFPGEAPYAFFLPGHMVTADGNQPSNSASVEGVVPFKGDMWTQFSWACDPWQPGALPGTGQGMTDFVRSISLRLLEVN
jgi:hypothetical protein